MRHALILAACTLALLLSATACGDDKMERGLVVDEEIENPASKKEMVETEKERHGEFVDEVEDEEIATDH